MAFNCNAIRANLARQTPVYDQVFLDDYISDMVNAPYLGRHQTETWSFETDRIFYDKMHVMQPDFLTPWGVIDASECGSDPCNPPDAFIGFGSTRDSAVMEQLDLRSQPYCLQQLLRIPQADKQFAKIFKVVRQIPIAFSGDFVRTRTVSYHDTLRIAGSAFNEFGITAGNTTTQLGDINLGSASLLPTSELTYQYLQYYSQILGLRGYDMGSGLAKNMRNIVTHPRTWYKLVGQNPEIKALLHLEGVKDVSPLYMLGSGVNADPFGNFAVTFDEQQARFQHVGSGLLERVLPYQNSPATTGERPLYNPAWLNARYAISNIVHPQATVLYTPKPRKIHEMVPSVNSSIYGEWRFINDNVLIWSNPDGTTCTKQNDNQFYFYWICHLELGFRYDQRDLVIPILHLIDGSGRDCMVDSPVCGSAPQYSVQDYTGNPIICQV